jgi:hypothetical protein
MALTHEVRFASIGAAGKAGSWILLPPFAKSHFLLMVLRRVVYPFQVRAVGKLGYTEWNDSTNRRSTLWMGNPQTTPFCGFSRSHGRMRTATGQQLPISARNKLFN